MVGKIFLASCALLIASCGAWAAPSIEILQRCSVPDKATGQNYIPEKNFPALSRLLSDDVLAQYDTGCKGALSAAEQAKYNDDRKVAARRRLHDL